MYLNINFSWFSNLTNIPSRPVFKSDSKGWLSAGEHPGQEYEMCSCWNPSLTGDGGVQYGDQRQIRRCRECWAPCGNAHFEKEIDVLRGHRVCVHVARRCLCPSPYPHGWVFSSFIFWESSAGMSKCQQSSPWELNLDLQLLPGTVPTMRENSQHGRCPKHKGIFNVRRKWKSKKLWRQFLASVPRSLAPRILDLTDLPAEDSG